MSKAVRVIVARCYECDSCQEFILTPHQAPECTQLQVTFPDDLDAKTFGTERKAYRTIEAWADKRFKCNRGISFLTVVWRQGTSVPPVLRKPFIPRQPKPLTPQQVRVGFKGLSTTNQARLLRQLAEEHIHQATVDPQQPAHPYGGYAHYGCPCTGCKETPR